MKIKIKSIKNKFDEEEFVKILEEVKRETIQVNKKTNQINGETMQDNKETNQNINFCIDFEFNGKEIGLMQLYITKLNLIFLLNPETFSKKNKSILIDVVFLSKNKKILHGSESNDIPYIFNKLLNREPDKILLFLNNYYDTRFICSLLSFPRCNLYQALINCEIINDSKLVYLKNVEEKLGKIWKIKWNPITLDYNEKLYALYDVIFLSKLLRKQKKLCKINGLNINKLLYALRIVLLYRQNLLNHFKIKKIENVEEYFGKILDIDYLRKLRSIYLDYL